MRLLAENSNAKIFPFADFDINKIAHIYIQLYTYKGFSHINLSLSLNAEMETVDHGPNSYSGI